MFDTYEDILTVYDVAEALLVGKNRVYELLEKGELQGIRMGHIWRIPKQELISFVERNSTCKQPVD